MHLGDRTVIVTRRNHPEVGYRETQLLDSLNQTGPPAPTFITYCEGWLLQENVPDWPDVEEELLSCHLDAFYQGSNDQNRRYLAIVGTLLLCYELHWFLQLKGRGSWWKKAYYLVNDMLKPSYQTVHRIACRTARWLFKHHKTERLHAFLDTIASRINANSSESVASLLRLNSDQTLFLWQRISTTEWKNSVEFPSEMPAIIEAVFRTDEKLK